MGTTSDQSPHSLGSKIKKTVKKWSRILLVILIIALGAYIYIKYFYAWADGNKAGQLNYVVYKGYIFKTYEGKLIQAGLRSPDSKNPVTGVQSNEFIFSISDKKVAEELMIAGGREVLLHYKEYLGVVPWRGNSRYVVDKIVEIKDSHSPTVY